MGPIVEERDDRHVRLPVPARARWAACLTVVLLLAFAAATWQTFLTSGPQTIYARTSDTIAYVRMASLPVMSRGFLAGERGFVYALFLKVNGNDLARAGFAQTLLAIISWGFLALSLPRLLATPLGKVLGLGLVLMCALRGEVLLWNGVSLSESLSCSLFALWIGSWVMFMRGKGWFWKLLPLPSSFLLAFVRDSNAFLVLGAAIALALACALRFAAVRYALMSLALLIFFVGSQVARSSSFRSEYSLDNLLGGRILIDPWRVNELRRHGMTLPMSESDIAYIAGRCGDDFLGRVNRQVVMQRPGAREFSAWAKGRHYAAYLKFLLLNPRYVLFQPLIEDGALKFLFPLASWVPPKPCGNGPLRSYQPPGYRSFVPESLDRLLRGESPEWMLAIWGVVLALSAAASLRDRPLRGRLLLPSLLLVAAYPHLLVIWHGDAMEVTRHALLVGIQVHLSLAMFAAVAVDALVAHVGKSRTSVPSRESG